MLHIHPPVCVDIMLSTIAARPRLHPSRAFDFRPSNGRYIYIDETNRPLSPLSPLSSNYLSTPTTPRRGLSSWRLAVPPRLYSPRRAVESEEFDNSLYLPNDYFYNYLKIQNDYNGFTHPIDVSMRSDGARGIDDSESEIGSVKGEHHDVHQTSSRLQYFDDYNDNLNQKGLLSLGESGGRSQDESLSNDVSEWSGLPLPNLDSNFRFLTPFSHHSAADGDDTQLGDSSGFDSTSSEYYKYKEDLFQNQKRLLEESNKLVTHPNNNNPFPPPPHGVPYNAYHGQHHLAQSDDMYDSLSYNWVSESVPDGLPLPLHFNGPNGVGDFRRSHAMDRLREQQKHSRSDVQDNFDQYFPDDATEQTAYEESRLRRSVGGSGISGGDRNWNLTSKGNRRFTNAVKYKGTPRQLLRSVSDGKRNSHHQFHAGQFYNRIPNPSTPATEGDASDTSSEDEVQHTNDRVKQSPNDDSRGRQFDEFVKPPVRIHTVTSDGLPLIGRSSAWSPRAPKNTYSRNLSDRATGDGKSRNANNRGLFTRNRNSRMDGVLGGMKFRFVRGMTPANTDIPKKTFNEEPLKRSTPDAVPQQKSLLLNSNNEIVSPSDFVAALRRRNWQNAVERYLIKNGSKLSSGGVQQQNGTLSGQEKRGREPKEPLRLPQGLVASKETKINIAKAVLLGAQNAVVSHQRSLNDFEEREKKPLSGGLEGTGKEERAEGLIGTDNLGVTGEHVEDRKDDDGGTDGDTEKTQKEDVNDSHVVGREAEAESGSGEVEGSYAAEANTAKDIKGDVDLTSVGFAEVKDDFSKLLRVPCSIASSGGGDEQCDRDFHDAVEPPQNSTTDSHGDAWPLADKTDSLRGAQREKSLFLGNKLSMQGSLGNPQDKKKKHLDYDL